MTISTTAVPRRPITSGTTIDITDLAITANTEVSVIREAAGVEEASPLVLTTDYTVSADLATVTLNVAIDGVVLTKATATLNTPQTQELDLENFDDFNVENVEVALDKVTNITRELSEVHGRTLKFNISTDVTNIDVDDPTGKEGQFTKLNSDGTSIGWQALSATAGLGAIIDDVTPQLGGNLDTNGKDINVKNGDNVVLKGASFDTTIDKTAPTAARTWTIPDATDTAIGKATTDTLTNKTVDADGTGNVITNIGSSEIKSELITGQSDVTILAGDSIIYSDASDSGNLKKDTVQGILDLATGTAATQADQETGTSTTAFVSPGRQQFHPSSSKSWHFTTYSAGTPTLVVSHNVSSIVDTGVGILTINFDTDFSSVDYLGVSGSQNSVHNAAADTFNIHAVGSVRENHWENNALTDPVWIGAVFYGDQ